MAGKRSLSLTTRVRSCQTRERVRRDEAGSGEHHGSLVRRVGCSANGLSAAERLRRGPVTFNPYTGIINIFDNLARAGQTIPVYEDGGMTRDFVHIDDVVQALMAALAMDPRSKASSMWVRALPRLSSRLRRPPHACTAPRAHGVWQIPDGDIRAAVADVSELERRLGLKAQVAVSEASAGSPNGCDLQSDVTSPVTVKRLAVFFTTTWTPLRVRTSLNTCVRSSR